ncbi:MAG TPA: hypothetical protein VIA18_28870 [Polyangia bacterium]|jgi:hypothetical protein|nr:hypothetical protein [Polyangia bacterium]
MSSKSYDGVTQAVWECVKANSIAQNNAVYDPPDGDAGTVTIPTAVGTVVLDYALDPTASTVTYTIKSKPFLVPESAMWSGIGDSIDGCIKSSGGG